MSDDTTFIPRHLRDGKHLCRWHLIASGLDTHHRPEQCTQHATPGTGVWLCRDHLRRVGYMSGMISRKRARQWIETDNDLTVEQLRHDIDRLTRTVNWQAARLRGEAKPDGEPVRSTSDGTVYALLAGFNVKVGYTSRPLIERLREYPPSTTVLTYFPGHRGDETRIKRKFAHLRTHGNEWLPYAPQVIEWVEQMNAEHGAPDPAMKCGPSKREVPRPHADKPQIRPRGWVGGTGALPTGKSA